MAKGATGTYHGRRSGPPGDTGDYWMPRDFARWEKAWDVWLDENIGPGLNIDGTPGRATGSVPTTRRGEHVEVDMSPEAVAERERAKARHAEAIAYVAQYVGRWGLPLDIRANPRWGTKHLKLSERQVDALLKGRDRDLERAQQAEISRELWQDEEYLRHVAGLVALGEAVADILEPDRQREPLHPVVTTMAEVGDGWYMVDGTPWKVQWNRERTRRYAKRLVDGTWEYVPGGMATVARLGQKMTVEDAVQFGKLYGACAVCGQTLTNEKSIERGIGPICFGRIAG